MRLIPLALTAPVTSALLFVAGCGETNQKGTPGLFGGGGNQEPVAQDKTVKPGEIKPQNVNRVAIIQDMNAKSLEELEFDLAVTVMYHKACIIGGFLKSNVGLALLKTDEDRKEALQLADEIEEQIKLYEPNKENSFIYVNYKEGSNRLKASLERAKNNKDKQEIFYNINNRAERAIDFIERVFNKAVKRKDGSEKIILSAFNSPPGYGCCVSMIEEQAKKLSASTNYAPLWFINLEGLAAQAGRFDRESPLSPKVRQVALAAGQ